MTDFSPIGYVECAQRYRYEAARQASIAPDNEAWIQLNEGQALQQGLAGLAEFERLWLLCELHLNETWHALVEPPREGMAKLGVFATRSPHRPNRIQYFQQFAKNGQKNWKPYLFMEALT